MGDRRNQFPVIDVCFSSKRCLYIYTHTHTHYRRHPTAMENSTQNRPLRKKSDGFGYNFC